MTLMDNFSKHSSIPTLAAVAQLYAPCLPLFMCTTKWNTTNAFQEELPKSVCHYPHFSISPYLPRLYDGKRFALPLSVYSEQL